MSAAWRQRAKTLSRIVGDRTDLDAQVTLGLLDGAHACGDESYDDEAEKLVTVAEQFWERQVTLVAKVAAHLAAVTDDVLQEANRLGRT